MTATSRLIVSLGEPQEPILWCFGSPAEPHSQQQGAGSPGEPLPIAGDDKETIVLVPNRYVVLRNAQFHGSPRLATAQALAFQFEDELLEDVEELHWVILGHEGTNYALAGYRHTDMQNWLALLKPLGVQPDIIVPDVLAFPYTDAHKIYVLHQYALFRNGRWSGYGLPQGWPLEQLDAVAKGACSDAADATTLWHCATTEFDQGMTLLQGKFASRAPWPRGLSWQGVALSAGLVLMLGALTFGGLQYRHQSQVMQQQTAQIHAQLFGGEKIPPHPLTAIKKRIKALQHRQQQPQFFELGQQLRQALPTQYQNTVQALQFDATHAELTLTLNTADVEPFSHINEQGNQVSLQKIVQEDAAKLTVKENR